MSETPALENEIHLVKWHLDRYDRLRMSTASRASVVLSAGAILFAGNALILSQLLGKWSDEIGVAWLAWFSVAAAANAIPVTLSVIRALAVLVTPRDSRSMFTPPAEVPLALVFNGTDTVAHLPSFADFQTAFMGQGSKEVLAAAQVELWINIQQHRYRYIRLRTATRLLRLAAIAFLFLLLMAMIVNIGIRL